LGCDFAVLRANQLRFARQRGRQMIQVAVRNKYSFNMQVSARPMAALATGYTSKKCLKTAGNDGMELVYLSQFTSTCS
jgi:hypothetical protein